jgi:hypothetical protein
MGPARVGQASRADTKMPHGNESAVSERSEFGCVYGVKYGLFGTAAFPGSPDEITKSRGDDEIEIGTAFADTGWGHVD